jgi:hypothetical protein
MTITHPVGLAPTDRAERLLGGDLVFGLLNPLVHERMGGVQCGVLDGAREDAPADVEGDVKVRQAGRKFGLVGGEAVEVGVSHVRSLVV